jgi:hypothetical protein
MECLLNYVSGRFEDYAHFSLAVKDYLRLSLPIATIVHWVPGH